MSLFWFLVQQVLPDSLAGLVNLNRILALPHFLDHFPDRFL